MPHKFNWFDQHKSIGILLLRIFIGVRLVYGVMDNVFSWHHMLLFRNFLEQFHFPFPLVSALVSVSAQFLAGIMIILGWKIRWAALLMIINFLVALFTVHRADSFEEMTTVLCIIFINVLFLFVGPGKYAMEREAVG